MERRHEGPQLTTSIHTATVHQLSGHQQQATAVPFGCARVHQTQQLALVVAPAARAAPGQDIVHRQFQGAQVTDLAPVQIHRRRHGDMAATVTRAKRSQILGIIWDNMG